jgi:hypothetical protein
MRDFLPPRMREQAASDKPVALAICFSLKDIELGRDLVLEPNSITFSERVSHGKAPHAPAGVPA